MTNIEVPEAWNNLSDYQRNNVVTMLVGCMNLNAELSKDLPQICPNCKRATARFIRKSFPMEN